MAAASAHAYEDENAEVIAVNVIEEENADHVLLGWQGTRSRREHVLGSTIDPVVGRAPCDATLVKLGAEGERGDGDIMVLAGEGPHAPVAARRAAEFVTAADDAPLTLLNVQSPEPDTDEANAPTERGEAVIEALAERAGIQYMTYETEIRVAADTEQAILDAAEDYDTICVGATRYGPISQAVFGSLPETVGEEVEKTVVMARGPEESAMSVREALLRRLEV